MNNRKAVSFRSIDITGGFWAEKQKLNREKTIFAIEDRFRDTGRFEAFKFNWKDGSDIPRPHFFWDSDVAKWLEAVFFILAKTDDEQLESSAEEIISLIEKNQGEDGYFNIYHTVVEPGTRFTNRDHHELYCLGHLIEAAVSHFETTGTDRFIKILDKYIDLVIRIFTKEHSASFIAPGHEEIELALFKLYKLTQNKKYLDLAMFFLDNRSKDGTAIAGWCNTKNDQSHLPVREQREAVGHCVRACYLYSAMADSVFYSDDKEMLDACKELFDDIVQRKMYITGGIGSTRHGESFTVPYDLPNNTAYAETCAAIALAMFADRMKDIDFNSKYADIVELEIYNGIMSGISLDGESFFYVNPLEINLSQYGRHTNLMSEPDGLPITQRKKVFDCSCCPPNIARFIAGIGNTAYSYTDEAIFIHQFFNSSAEVNSAKITVATDYPHNGKIHINADGAKGKTLYIRIPGWCKTARFSVGYKVLNGYAEIFVDSNDMDIDIDFDMPVSFVVANPKVRANNKKAALMRGPVVYCMERVDNNFDLGDIAIDTKSKPEISFNEYFSCNTVKVRGKVSELFSCLYLSSDDVKTTDTEAVFIPYYAFANRGESDMTVWFAFE